MRSTPSAEVANGTDGGPEVEAALELLFRRRAGQLTATLTRILGVHNLDLVEDVVQDAFVQALRTWPRAGVPDDPGAWIVRVARNRAIDAIRRVGRWEDKQREIEATLKTGPEADTSNGLDRSDALVDDELSMIFAACHPAIPRDAQVALTLKAVGGFSIDEIARGFLASKAAIAQRIVRAKRVLREEEVSLAIPRGVALHSHLDSVLEVIYLMFNEGYSTSAGQNAVRTELCHEAIRLVELLAEHPELRQPRIDAMTALLLFQGARLPARTTADGDIVVLAEQDRRLWDAAMISKALRYFGRAARGGELSAYHVQAEIAAHHALASTYEDTPWSEILSCYDDLVELDPSPIVRLNRAIAVSEVKGPAEGLAALEALEDAGPLASYPYFYATRADLLARLDRLDEAERLVSMAIERASSDPARTHLENRLQTYRRAR